VVERQLPKLNVAGSIPVSRSNVQAKSDSRLTSLFNLYDEIGDGFSIRDHGLMR
jgi:hypothetical protein